MRDVNEAMRIPQIQRVLLFFVICGLASPSFSDIGYYFSLNLLISVSLLLECLLYWASLLY